MKNSNLITLLAVTALYLGSGITNLLMAQDLYRLTGKPVLTVMGGSTIHDWEMSSATSQGKAEMFVEGASLKNIKSANVTMKAESLKSGKNKMDGIAYDALKTKKHADILFTLTSFKNLGSNKALATGNLTIAGTTKPVSFKVEISTKGDMVCLSGETAIKFTDFNITPPTAMMGAIKTSNDLKLLFRVDFQQATIQ